MPVTDETNKADAATEANETGIRISDAATRAGVSARTLRYYEELGLLTPSLYTAGGERVRFALTRVAEEPARANEEWRFGAAASLLRGGKYHHEEEFAGVADDGEDWVPAQVAVAETEPLLVD